MASFPSPEPFEKAFDDARSKNWDRLLQVRNHVLKILEESRAAKTISSALEAKVVLRARGEMMDLLKAYSASLPALFIVSQVDVLPFGEPVASNPLDPASAAYAEQYAGLHIAVERAHGKKCTRCWNYSTHVGESEDYPDFCERCVAAMDEIERGSTAGSAAS